MSDGIIFTNTIVFDDQVMGGQHLEATEALIEAWEIVLEVTGESVVAQCSDLLAFQPVKYWSEGDIDTERMIENLDEMQFLAVEGAISEILLDLDTVAFVDIAKRSRLY